MRISFNSFIVPILTIAFFIALTPIYHETDEALNVFSAAKTSNDLTLIIDPGHGGADGGAVSISGIHESSINLAIALRMEQIAAFFGISPVMTRTSEEIVYPDDADTIRKKKVADQNNRLKLIESSQFPVLISIHQNKFSTSGPSGAAVYYAKTSGSAEFASYIQNEMLVALDPENKRTATLISDDIYLMKNLTCPAVLVECGFLSNTKEEALLLTDNYRLKIAAVLTASYLNCVKQLAEAHIGGTNETEDNILLH